MLNLALPLAALITVAPAPDVQQKAAAPTAKGATPEKSAAPAKAGDKLPQKAKDIARLLFVLGLPQANSESARKQLTAAAKDPKLSGYPAAYWKDYQDAAGPEVFANLLHPVFDKAYTAEEVSQLLQLMESPELKAAAEKHPKGMALFFQKHPSLLTNVAYKRFSEYMGEVGKKLREKHGLKEPAPAK